MEKILYLSYHDNLTGLYNRHFMEKELERQELKGNLPLSVIMADVNGLKLANDVFGHAEGDKLLRRPLTEDEWVEMRKHPEIGCRIAQNTPELGPIAEYILYHHER